MRTLNIVNRSTSGLNPLSLFNHGAEYKQRDFTLLQQLQTSLELKNLIDIFAIEVAKYVDFSGLYFKNADVRATARNSRQGKSERQFELKLNGSFIGILTYAINTPISMTNYKILTELHQLLIHPINNAVTYHRAMQLAMHDDLTSLGNRRNFDEQLKRAMAQATRRHSRVGLILCDLNKFKAINDSFGHHIGDCVLVKFADALRTCVRNSDSIFRFGGDEFAIVVEDACEQSLTTIEHRLYQAIQEDAVLAKYKLTCSLGLAFMTRADDELSFFNRADASLYSQKMNMPRKLSLV